MGFDSRTIESSPRTATLFIALTSVCFGMVPLFAKTLLEQGLSPEAIALYRFGLTVPLALLLLPRRRDQWPSACVLIGGGVAMGLGWTAYLRSLDHVSIASAGIVYMSYPVFVVLIAWIMFRQPMTPRSILSASMVLIAAALAFPLTDHSASEWQQLVRCLPAPITFGLIVVLIAGVGHRIPVVERWSCISIGAFLGLLPMSLAVDPQGLLPTETSAWFWVLAMVVLTAAAPQIIYCFAATRVGANRAATAGAVELPTMFVIGWLAFAESISPTQIAAGAFVVAAILIAPVVRPESLPSPLPSPSTPKLEPR